MDLKETAQDTYENKIYNCSINNQFVSTPTLGSWFYNLVISSPCCAPVSSSGAPVLVAEAAATAPAAELVLDPEEEEEDLTLVFGSL